jgi:hypothetical protein
VGVYLEATLPKMTVVPKPKVYLNDRCCGVYVDDSLPKGSKKAKLELGSDQALQLNLPQFFSLSIGKRLCNEVHVERSQVENARIENAVT